ncbi:uncharacterized protein BDR25DRAFT_334684 [Lindgomyces ingoldianus]|uniref:Uncharacterized protein n=1 Tax=Lindgomyces ingoldianus TaxID=673940 RepID=A0ACB6QTR2_9PLEO|nr:uncharacterized protein BDR25DRAFT_334684 [Lindgomyces ingoldianus]KAF2470237.1 hypothetical protein BDR25DRAFT_334684 [Lindgomyces ingoldianus]
MAHNPTVAERKTKFLRTQDRFLSRRITPSEKAIDVARQAGIHDGVFRDVMTKVNQNLKRHSRIVHNLQAINSIVQQIDDLYWSSGAASLDDDAETATDAGGEDSNTLYQGDDLTVDKNISKLPPIWDTSADHLASVGNEDQNAGQDDYIAVVTRLQDLSAKRLTIQQKLNTYRALLSLLDPYRSPQENVQPNIATQKGPLVPELMKTRTFAIRVAGRISERFGDVQVSATAEEDDGSGVVMGEDDGKTKLENILSGW